MKVVILCGGLGTRLAEETSIKPKPMVEIGGRPILWHIMKIYEKHNFNDFVLALGYKGEYIKDYFLNYHSRQSDLYIDLRSGNVNFSNPNSEEWSVALINTGEKTLTGGRLLRLQNYLKDENTFMLTYGDGVSNIDITELLKFHKSHGKIATISAVKPSARFGGLKIDDGKVTNFKEKPQSGEGYINGGFFIFNKEIFNFIKDDNEMLEHDPLEKLVELNELMAYQHEGYWQCMDTIRDKESLQSLWDTDNAYWLK
jgi:glucose-1-phosphate cytidylyltransferase